LNRFVAAVESLHAWLLDCPVESNAAYQVWDPSESIARCSVHYDEWDSLSSGTLALHFHPG